MNNQGNYQQYRMRLPPPPPFQQAGTSPNFPPVSIPPSGTLTSSQPYSSWSQSQHMLPLIPPGHHQIPRIPPPGQQFYRVPPPRLPPPPSSSFFTPAPSGPFALPPPPPPSSPPPRPPPLPPSSPPLNSNHHDKDSEMSAKDTSSFNILSDIHPPPPKDEKTRRRIEVLCQYIAKNGQEFEEMTCQKEAGNPDYEFFFGGEPGSEAAISHEYFKWVKRKCHSDKLLEGGHDRDLASKPSVVGTLHEDISHSPASSDMDMEDDITQPEDIEKQEAAVISNAVDIKVENNTNESPTSIERESSLFPNDDTQFEKSKITVGVEDSELSSDCKTKQMNINLYEKMSQLEQSPFELIQGYASDDNSENDNNLHFENVSPAAVSPQVEEHTTPSVPVLEGSMTTTSKVPEHSTETETVENRIALGDSVKHNNHLEVDGTQKEDNSDKLETDEFGRAVKKGGNDSDSDNYSTRRRVKRGRSRSRSRSPYKRSRSRSYEKRRRRSPRRRRDKRSPSRSRSPRRRGRSRSPYNRRNRSQLQEICHDFRMGRCFRGASCRYLHEPEKSEESRWHKNKLYDHKVSDRVKNSDRLAPEREEVGYHASRSGDGFKEELLEVEPSGHCHSAEVASGHENEHPANETAMTGQIPTSGYPLNQPSQPEQQLASEYNLMPPATTTTAATATLWNSLPPPPPPPAPRPQLGRPLLQYQMNQPPLQTNYPYRPFVAPYGTQVTTHLGAYPMNYPILQQPVGPAIVSKENYVRMPSPNLVSSNSREPPAAINAVQSFLQNPIADIISDLGRSRILSNYNPYASTFDQPPSTNFSSGVFNQDCGPSGNQNQTPDEGQTRNYADNPLKSGGDQYDPLFDSIEPIDPISNPLKKSDAIAAASEENDGLGETADAEVGAVENDSPSPSSPIDLPAMATGEIEIDQVKNTKSKDSRSMKHFKIALASFVKEVLKPSWRQGNMSKEAFKTIVKKTVDKVSGAMKKHQIPKSQAKINHYIDSSQRKLTKLVMGYVDKYVKV